MSNHLTFWISVLIAVNAVGVAIDSWMSQRGQVRLYKSFQSWWESIDDGSFSRLPNRAASWFLSLEKRLFGDTAAKFIIVSALISITLTTFLLLWVEAWTLETRIYGSNTWIDPDVALFLQKAGFFENLVAAAQLIFLGGTQAFGSQMGSGFYTLAGYTINFLFDVLTLFVTVKILRIAVESATPTALALIAIDGLIAVVLAVLCGAVSGWLLYDERIELIFGGKQFGRSESIFAWIYNSSSGLVEFLSSNWAPISDMASSNLSLGAYSATTLIPTLLYITCIACLLIAKPVARYASPLAAALVSRLIRDNPEHHVDQFKPFTLLGILLSAIGGVLGVIATYVSVYNGS